MRKSLWISLLVVTVLLSACGGAQQPNVPPETESGQIFMLALPRVMVDLDQEGRPSILGIKLADLSGILGPGIGQPVLPAATVKQLTDGGVQMLQARQTGAGLEVLVDGKLMPHVVWNDQSLATAGQVAGVAGLQNVQTITRLLPIIRRLGLDVVLRLPRAEGVAEIPPVEGPAPQVAASGPISPTAVVRMEVTYDDQGIPSILGVTGPELAQLGINIPQFLTPDTIQKLKANNIQNMELRTRPSGLTMYVNGNPLPSLGWDEAMLTNATDLYTRMSPGNPYDPLIKQSPPFVRGADVGILLHFPVAEGQTAIPAKLHE